MGSTTYRNVSKQILVVATVTVQVHMTNGLSLQWWRWRSVQWRPIGQPTVTDGDIGQYTRGDIMRTSVSDPQWQQQEFQHQYDDNTHRDTMITSDAWKLLVILIDGVYRNFWEHSLGILGGDFGGVWWHSLLLSPSVYILLHSLTPLAGGGVGLGNVIPATRSTTYT